MPQILTLTANLQGVTSLTPIDTPEQPFWWTFTIQCTSCRETHDSAVGINRHETHEQSGSRGSAHLVWRCRNCRREHSASIKQFIGDGGGVQPYEAHEPAKRQKVLEVDNRGLELVDFKPGQSGDWKCVGAETSTKFEAGDLGEGEWFDYDEKASEEVSITDLVWEVRRNV